MRILLENLSRGGQVLLVACVVAGSLQAAPVLPGLLGKHGMSEVQIGRLLMDEMRCAACHDGLDGSRMKAAPDLATVGGRLTPAFLELYLANPATVHPGTTMPALMNDKSEKKRAEAAEAMAHYLVTLADARVIAEAPASTDVAAGKDLFHSVGCVACHSPRDTAGKPLSEMNPLTHVADKYTLASLAEFLVDPLKARPSGRMPNLNLKPTEARQLASYLIAPEPKPVAAMEKRFLRSTVGKGYVKKLNCAACHDLDGIEAEKATPLAKMTVDRGCLAEQAGKAPDFDLSTEQRQAIRAALAVAGEKPTMAEQIHLEMVRFNCIACHEREDYGGVAAGLDQYFHTSEEGLGNEARIPPPLTDVGAKLRPEWLDRVLFEGAKVRPYMHVRMPQFGEGLGDLATYLLETDKIEPSPLAEPEGKARRTYRDAGHLLTGEKGLNCIACHNFNAQDSPGFKGLDLMTTYQRLQPDWFAQYMKNPGAFRPGIVMPSYWPGGKAIQTEVLGGETQAQLEALWHFLSLGRSAPNPHGISTPPTDLTVADKVVTYRGRSGPIAGYRGIAVGNPGDLHYAFNAEYGTLTGLWNAEFVSVNWRGQGSGDFRPKNKFLSLGEDVAMLATETLPEKWPLRPRTSKEQPTNPKPLYPRDLGYQFRGYEFDGKRVPTFLYNCGTIAVKDRSEVVVAEGKAVLKRRLQFTSPNAQTLYFRVAAGAVSAVSATEYKADKIRVTVPSGKPLLRDAEVGKELILEIKIPAGSSDLQLEYAIDG